MRKRGRGWTEVLGYVAGGLKGVFFCFKDSRERCKASDRHNVLRVEWTKNGSRTVEQVFDSGDFVGRTSDSDGRSSVCFLAGRRFGFVCGWCGRFCCLPTTKKWG